MLGGLLHRRGPLPVPALYPSLWAVIVSGMSVEYGFYLVPQPIEVTKPIR